MTEWIDSLTTWLSHNPEWLGLAIFLVALLECLTLVGILIPGVVLLFAIAALAGSGGLSLWSALLCAYTGGLLGDILSYAIGRRFQGGIARLPVLRQHPEWICSAETYFLRYGAISLLVGRFIGPLRPMLPTVAGMLRMPFWRFFAISLLASAGWSIAYLAPGWLTGAAMRLSLPEGFWSEAVLILIGCTLLIGLCLHASLNAKRHTTPLSAALSLILLLSMLACWPWLNSFDQGLSQLAQNIRSSEGDQVAVFITHLGDLRIQFAAALLLLSLLAIARQWRNLCFAGMTLLGSALSNLALKNLFERARPEVLLDPLSGYSFPSGHSSAAFAFCLVLGVLAGRGQPPRWRATWMLIAAIPASCVAVSRVYLGAHWPTDVIAGALLASTLCALSLLATQWRSPIAALPKRLWAVILLSCLSLLIGYAIWATQQAAPSYLPVTPITTP